MFRKFWRINKNKNTKVYVGLSGGVDSAVSAALLKKQGYNVTACFIKTWAPDGYPCPYEEDKFASMTVAAHLGIPWVEFDATDSYKKNVADYIINGYKSGITPNPDVFCNKTVKFGVFFDWAIANGADYVATGHYAQIDRTNYEIKFIEGVDPSKDQTYFLWSVSYEKLKKTMFPIGSYPKTKVRELAKKFKLPNMNRPDSQGVCFLGEIDMKKFLKENLNLQTGNVINTSGEIIGTHDGVEIYTIGERHGFVVFKNNDKPYYVINKNIENNELIVDTTPALKNSNDFIITEENWLPLKPKENQIVDVVFRYHGQKYKCKISENNIQIIGEKPIVAIGQSAVFYMGNICLGGGIINFK